MLEERKQRGISWFIVFLLCIQVGNLFAQENKEISYRCTNEKLAVALRQIERLSGYYKIQFAFEDVEPYTVSADLKGVTVNTVLNDLLRETPLKYSINKRFIQIFVSDEKVTKGALQGCILDTDGTPLIGVSVYNNSDGNGVVTDFDGNFLLLTQKKEGNLTISYG